MTTSSLRLAHCKCQDRKKNINEIVATATDLEGNSAECKFEVVVEGTAIMIFDDAVMTQEDNMRERIF